MDKDILQQILQEHKVWLVTGGTEGKRANLFGAFLTSADLTGANLSRANLFGAFLTSADLTGANLAGANLSRANLFGANLTGANLTGANLSRADLAGANLTGANLTGANLFGANLPYPIYQFFIGKHNAVAILTELVIGCERHSWEHWLKEYKNIGKKAGYDDVAIKQHIIMIKAMHKCIKLGVAP